MLGAAALVAAAAVGAGYAVVALQPTDTGRLGEEPFREGAKLLVVCLALFATFLPIGILISTLLAWNPSRIARLYALDLLGAGAACAAAVGLLRVLSPPGCIALARLLLAAVAGRLAWRGPPALLAASIAASALFAAGVVLPSRIPEPRADASKGIQPDTPRLFGAWDPVFRVDVVEGFAGVRVVHHDGLRGSGMHRFDGAFESLARFERDPRSFAFRVA